MNYYRRLWAIGYKFTALALLACPVFASAAQNEAYRGKVLIVSNSARLDDSVLLKVTQMLRKEGNYVRISSGTTLEGMQAEKYGAVIIFNLIADKRKDRSVKIFADDSVQKKIVLFNGVGDYLTPDINRPGSRTVKSEKIASDIVKKTRIILEQQ